MKVQKFNTATNKRELDLVNLADLASEVTDAFGSQLDSTEKTLFVSPNFTETGQFYNDLETAITFANDETEAYTIIVFKGTYEINSTISYDHTIVCIDAVIKQYNVSNPALTFDAGSIIGNAIITDEGKTPTEYLIKVENNCVIEADRIESDYGAIHFAQTEPTTTDVEIRANYIDKIKEDSSNGTLAKIDANWLTDLEIDGSSSSVITVNGKLMTGNVAINNGRTNLSVTNYDRGSINVVTVTGGTLVLTGRMEHYADVTPPVVQSSGTLVMNQFFGKNGSGSVVSGSGGTLLMANSVLEAGSVGGGGASATISATPSYTVKYNNASSLNTAPTGGLTELVTANKTTDAGITI